MKVVRRDPNRGYVDSWLWVPKTFINVEATKHSLTQIFQERGGRDKVLELFREAPQHLLVPRAFWRTETLPFETVDCRPRTYPKINFVSRVQLDHRLQKDAQGLERVMPTGGIVQAKAFAALLGGMGGVLQLGCGKGKTTIALHTIAAQQVPALILLDNTQLLHQWQGEIEKFLEVPGGVGLIAAGAKDWQKGLVLSTYHSVANWADTMPEEVRRWFGVVFWDEGHRCSAPVFSKTIPLFYGRRYLLTATPERDDGFHIIADMHIGPVLYKDLTQPLTARFIFYWTGLQPDVTDPACDILDKNKELHMSKVSRYFGRWLPRLHRVTQDAADAVSAGRKVLVLCNSVDEVVNLWCIWTYGPHAALLTDIPYPTPDEVGSTEMPLALSLAEGKDLERALMRAYASLDAAQKKGASKSRLEELRKRVIERKTEWGRYTVHKKLENLHEARRKAFIRARISEVSTAGFMVHEVPAAARQKFVQERPVTFAIMKYGKEGLDAPKLDTILVSSAISSKNGLQQLMGRITGRPSPDKKSCVVVFYRDNVPAIHGMCKKLEKHLRSWPADEGGPFDFEHINNPVRAQWQKTSTLKEAFQQ